MYDTCMYVSLMLLETDLLTLSMAEGLKLAPFINPVCGQMHWRKSNRDSLDDRPL